MDNDLHSKQFLGSGWAFPVTFSTGNYELSMTLHEDNVNDSISLILHTTQGERYMEPRFGSGLQQFFFRKMDEALRGEIEDAVKSSLMLNEPRITVTEVEAVFTDVQNGLIDITIVYFINRTNTRHNYVFPFYLKEGTNLG